MLNLVQMVIASVGHVTFKNLIFLSLMPLPLTLACFECLHMKISLIFTCNYQYLAQLLRSLVDSSIKLCVFVLECAGLYLFFGARSPDCK